MGTTDEAAAVGPGVTVPRDQRVVLLTGAAAGIGAAAAGRLVRSGARVVAVDRDAESLGVVTKSLGDAVYPVVGDVRDRASLDAAAADAVDRFGRIDVVVANAGILGPHRPVGAPAEAGVSFEDVIDVNLLGVWRTLEATLPHLQATRGYALVVASIAAFVPSPTYAAYSTSKAGVEMLARNVRMEQRAHGVDIGIAYFGLVDTTLVDGFRSVPSVASLVGSLPGPLGRPIPPEAAAAAIVDGITHRRARVTAQPWVLPLQLLRGVLAPLDRYLAGTAPMARLTGPTTRPGPEDAAGQAAPARSRSGS